MEVGLIVGSVLIGATLVIGGILMPERKKPESKPPSNTDRITLSIDGDDITVRRTRGRS